MALLFRRLRARRDTSAWVSGVLWLGGHHPSASSCLVEPNAPCKGDDCLIGSPFRIAAIHPGANDLGDASRRDPRLIYEQRVFGAVQPSQCSQMERLSRLGDLGMSTTVNPKVKVSHRVSGVMKEGIG